MRRNQEDIEIFRKKQSMSSQIVTQEGKEDYAWYAGASFSDAKKMAAIDVMLEFGLIPEGMRPMVKFYRAYLDQNRKAFFASVGCSEVSKLGFIQGEYRRIVSATDST